MPLVSKYPASIVEHVPKCINAALDEFIRDRMSRAIQDVGTSSCASGDFEAASSVVSTISSSSTYEYNKPLDVNDSLSPPPLSSYWNENFIDDDKNHVAFQLTGPILLDLDHEFEWGQTEISPPSVPTCFPSKDVHVGTHVPDEYLLSDRSWTHYNDPIWT
jgi:hypothetical protein